MSETINKERVLFFAGKKMTLGEFIQAYDLENESEGTIELVIAKLEKKNKLSFLEQKDGSNQAFEQAAKELDLEARIAEMEADAEEAEAYEIKKKREGKLTYEEVEIDFPNKSLGLDFFEYAEEKLKLDAKLEKRDGVFVLTLYNVTESDLGAIKRRKAVTKVGTSVLKTTDKVAGTAVETVNFATEKVVVPTAKAAIKASLGLGKSLVRTGAQVGSTLITSTSKQSKSMAKELSKDEDVLNAKKELIDAKDAIMRLFKGGGKSSPDVRIK